MNSSIFFQTPSARKVFLPNITDFDTAYDIKNTLTSSTYYHFTKDYNSASYEDRVNPDYYTFTPATAGEYEDDGSLFSTTNK